MSHQLPLEERLHLSPYDESLTRRVCTFNKRNLVRKFRRRLGSFLINITKVSTEDPSSVETFFFLTSFVPEVSGSGPGVLN